MLVKSHLKKDSDKLERIQKRAARWACCRWNRHTYTWSHSYEEACKHLKLKTLESRRVMLSVCQVYKIIHKLDCIPFNLYFTFNTNCTRSHQLSLLCTASRVNCFRYSFFLMLLIFGIAFCLMFSIPSLTHVLRSSCIHVSND